MKKALWDKFWAGRRLEEIYPPVTDIVVELKGITEISNKRILETGAGTGRDGIRLSQEGADVYLLDYSWESLMLINDYLKKNQKLKHKVSLIMADALQTPFKEKTFDVVFHQGLLEHFPSPTPLLKENKRILKDNGILLVDVPQTFHIYTILKQILMFIGEWFGGWERQFTINSLKRLLRGQNFEPIHFYGDWSRPGIFYKILRQILGRLNVNLPMYPEYLGCITKKFYLLQDRLRRKRLFLYTTLAIGVIARKGKK
ncbi:MAG: class I SAM-dependent methyltransferase [candidate division WOR-3 bacterium]